MSNQVTEDHSAIPVLEDEAIQFDFLLVEPQDDHVSVDAFLCIHRNNSEKCMQMDDIPCKFGGSNFSTDQEQQQLKSREVPDVKPSEFEAGEFQASNGLSSCCDDYLLDGEFEECGIEVCHESVIGLQKTVSGNQNQADSSGDNGTSQKSDSSGTTDPVDNCQGGLNVNDPEPHGIIFSCTSDSEKSLENCWFKYPQFTVENMEEDVSSMFTDGNDQLVSFNSGLTSGQMPSPFTSNQENRHSLPCQKEVKESSLQKDESLTKRPVQDCSIDNQDEKRLRKPPKRFIDELSGPKSKSLLKKKEASSPSSKVKHSNIRAAKHHNKKSGAESFSPEDPLGFAIQVPFGPLVQQENEANQDPDVAKAKVESHHLLDSPPNLKVLKSDKEDPMSESEEDNLEEVKLEEGGGRRKHHILWTVSEVKKLIDGVSRYGVGRWSRIKKDLFSSSAHRTPVDLKDKWRNLLKASRAQSGSKKGEDGKRNLAWRPLPKSILRRVNELATIYPYPRDLRAKH